MPERITRPHWFFRPTQLPSIDQCGDVALERVAGHVGVMEKGNLPSAILETCLSVANLERSREFYGRLFGYSVMQSDERFCAFSIEGRQVLILFLRESDPEGTTLPFGFIPPHGAKGQSHIGFKIPKESLRAWRERLKEEHVPIESSFTWPGGGVSLYFRDPDGHLLELLTPGVWPTY